MPDARPSLLVRWQRIALAVAVTAALLSGGGVVLSMFVKSPAQHLAETSPPNPSLLTAVVEHRTLTATIVTRGTVAAAYLLDVTPAGTDTADVLVVTAVHTAVGEAVAPGDVLAEVSGRPLIALRGAVPAYRDLRPNDEGNDVAQLQEALQELGYYTGTVDGRFGVVTKDAVARLYTELGFRVPTTGGPGGDEDRAALRAAEDAVEEAQRQVDNLQRIIDSAQDSGEAPPTAEEPLEIQMKHLRKALDDAIRDLEELVARTGPMVPRNEVIFVPAFPARVTALGAEVGEQVRSPLIILSAGELEITARFEPDQAELLAADMEVEIFSEVLGLMAAGRVRTIGEPTVDLAGDELGSGGQPGAPHVPVHVEPDEPLDAAWAGQDVRLTLSAAQTDGPVLVVPVSAVSASADGRTTVSRVGSDDRIARVEVNAGVSADGWVHIIPLGEELAAGDRVVIGQFGDMAEEAT